MLSGFTSESKARPSVRRLAWRLCAAMAALSYGGPTARRFRRQPITVRATKPVPSKREVVGSGVGVDWGVKMKSVSFPICDGCI